MHPCPKGEICLVISGGFEGGYTPVKTFAILDNVHNNSGRGLSVVVP